MEREANYLNDNFVKHFILCEDFIKTAFPETSEELLKDPKVLDGITTFFEARITRGDFE